MKILWSHPMTAPEPAALPDGWESIWMERVLSSKFATAFPRLGSYTEYLLRLYMAAVLLWRRRRSDAIVTGRYGEFFALAQGLWPFGRRPLLLLDIEWYSAHRSGWRGKLKRWLHRRMAAGADAIQVFCRIEAANYAARFGIPAKKFVWIPYCFSVPDSPEGAEGGFAFSGGLHHRDYPTLFAAVAGLPLELQVAAPRSHFADASVPPNVTILGVVSGDEYWRKMREARFVVVSLESGLARCPGVITYVAAMRMGKCAVVNEPSGAPDYIESGISGFVVPAGDAASLRRQIVSLVENEGLAGTVGSQAKLEAAERFSPAAYYSAVKAVVDRLIALS